MSDEVRIEAQQRTIQNLQEQLGAARQAAEAAAQRNTELVRELQESQALLEAQQAELRKNGGGKNGSPPSSLVGTVLQINPKAGDAAAFVLQVRVEGKTIQAEYKPAPQPARQTGAQAQEPEAAPGQPPAGNAEPAEVEPPFAVGDPVLVSPQNLAVLGKAETAPLLGPICLVRKVLHDGTSIETEHGGTTLVVSTGKFAGGIEKDDRVILDSTLGVVLCNLGKGEQPYLTSGETDVSFADVGGQEEAKQALLDAIINPYKYRQLYERFKRKPSKGVLLFGPTGNGKTLLVRALSTEIARAILGADAKPIPGSLIYVKGTEILIKWVGESEASLRVLFRAGKEFYRKHGIRCIICIDEAEAIARRRGSGISSDMESTLVPTLLTEMCGFEDSGVIVVLLTNRQDILDPAIVEDHRISTKIEVKRPDQAASRTILNIHLRDIPLKGISREELAEFAAAEIFDDRYSYYDVTLEGGRSELRFALRNLISGAKLAGIVALAVQSAINRCVETGNETGADEGVTREDVVTAIRSVHAQNLSLSHEAALDEFARDQNGRIIGYKRVRAAYA